MIFALLTLLSWTFLDPIRERIRVASGHPVALSDEAASRFLQRAACRPGLLHPDGVALAVVRHMERGKSDRTPRWMLTRYRR